MFVFLGADIDAYAVAQSFGILAESTVAYSGKRSRMSNAIEINKAVDRTQQMPLRHMTFERKLVEQSVLPDLAFPHHRLHPSLSDQSESAPGDQ
jgi:hypothetical protein